MARIIIYYYAPLPDGTEQLKGVDTGHNAIRIDKRVDYIDVRDANTGEYVQIPKMDLAAILTED